jgi:hypothetical protein
MISLLKRFWMYFAHTIKLSSNEDTVTVTCSCGWMCRTDGKEKWSDASHATEIHLGNIKSVDDCPLCKKSDLESVEDIAERTFPEEVAEIRQNSAPHIDSDRYIGGKSAWDKECQESGRLNRR